VNRDFWLRVGLLAAVAVGLVALGLGMALTL
jgi:hypothetical protein